MPPDATRCHQTAVLTFWANSKNLICCRQPLLQPERSHLRRKWNMQNALMVCAGPQRSENSKNRLPNGIDRRSESNQYSTFLKYITQVSLRYRDISWYIMISHDISFDEYFTMQLQQCSRPQASALSGAVSAVFGRRTGFVVSEWWATLFAALNIVAKKKKTAFEFVILCFIWCQWNHLNWYVLIHIEYYWIILISFIMFPMPRLRLPLAAPFRSGWKTSWSLRRESLWAPGDLAAHPAPSQILQLADWSHLRILW